MKISKTDIENKLIEKVEPLLLDLGFSLVDLDCIAMHRRTLRLFIEHSNGQCPTLDECAKVSRWVGDLFEMEMAGGYDLEVSSPGIERRLRTASDFVRFKGRKAYLKLGAPQDGRANVRGIIEGATKTHVEISFDAMTMLIPIESIKKVHLIWEEERYAV